MTFRRSGHGALECPLGILTAYGHSRPLPPGAAFKAVCGEVQRHGLTWSVHHTAAGSASLPLGMD